MVQDNNLAEKEEFNVHPGRPINYPGVGLTAPVEAFEAHKVWDQKYRRLSDDETKEYLDLVREWTTQVHLAKYHPGGARNIERVDNHG